ncbi:MAG TPA: hypothetical protein PK771_15335, partial [Spirochaetota bacterium]|nr:hypothetical protein [Spirochaetota bacterium]
MKKYFVTNFFIFSFFLLFSQEGKQILIVTDEWEGTTNKDGTGLYFDIIREVFKEDGYTFNIKFYPYARSVYLLERKEADLVIGPYKDEVKNA